MNPDYIEPIAPVNFVQMRIKCPYVEKITERTKYQELPDTSELCDEEKFATLSIAWNEEGLYFSVLVNSPIQQVNYPEFTRGDSVELFIDTRDVKTSGFNTRFCHHFYFLPESIGGHSAGEVTRFRTEDMHDLCDPKELKVAVTKRSNSYTMKITVPSSCLFGYDPTQFDRIGFSYRINRHGGSSQHFSVVSDEFQIEQQPSLWAGIRLIK